MTDQFTFKLIDGDFSQEDAAEILRTVIRTKINHHKTQQFSQEERFGKDFLNSSFRIKELQHSLELLEGFISQPELKGRKISLNSDVSISTKVVEPQFSV